jgi:hypothetical protein
MDIIAMWLIDIVLFSLLSFLPDCVTHCRFSHTLSATQYLFILCLVRWRGMVASVYRAGHVYINGQTVAAVCWSWLESAKPLRNVTSSVWMKLDDHRLVVVIIAECALLAQLPVLFLKVRTPSIPGTTSMICSLPGLGRIQQNYLEKNNVYQPHSNNIHQLYNRTVVSAGLVRTPDWYIYIYIYIYI